MEGGSQQKNIEPNTSSSIIDQLASAFYATECCSDFPQHAEHIATTPGPNEAQMSLYQSSLDNLFNESSLQTVLRHFLCSNMKNHESCGSVCKSLPMVDFVGSNYHSNDQIMGSPDGNGSLIGRHQKFSNKDHLNKSCTKNFEVTSFSSRSSASSCGPTIETKKRIRWTQDLHEKFVRCVDKLGGAQKATPKAILQMMESKGLTIFHVKSHLQKYRTEQYMPKCRQDAQPAEERITFSDIPQLYMKNSSMKIKEARQLQLDVENHLHEQLEIQQNLQMTIEKNARQLKKMLEQQNKTNKIMPTSSLAQRH